jgi:hypothetical protein
MSCVKIATITGKPERKCAQTMDGTCWDADECPHSKRHRYQKDCDQPCPEEDGLPEELFEKSWTDMGRRIILE